MWGSNQSPRHAWADPGRHQRTRLGFDVVKIVAKLSRKEHVEIATGNTGTDWQRHREVEKILFPNFVQCNLQSSLSPQDQSSLERALFTRG